MIEAGQIPEYTYYFSAGRSAEHRHKISRPAPAHHSLAGMPSRCSTAAELARRHADCAPIGGHTHAGERAMIAERRHILYATGRFPAAQPMPSRRDCHVMYRSRVRKKFPKKRHSHIYGDYRARDLIQAGRAIEIEKIDVRSARARAHGAPLQASPSLPQRITRARRSLYRRPPATNAGQALHGRLSINNTDFARQVLSARCTGAAVSWAYHRRLPPPKRH